MRKAGQPVHLVDGALADADHVPHGVIVDNGDAPAMADSPPPVSEVSSEIYDELRRIAAAYMRREAAGQTLQPTALVNEAYLRLAHARPAWRDRGHFVAIAARAMRQVLVDRARARGAAKRWASLDRVTLHDSIDAGATADDMLPALDEALARLEQLDPEQARIVELRFFAGLSVEDAAAALGMSPATLKRRWALARAWLHRELGATRE